MSEDLSSGGCFNLVFVGMWIKLLIDDSWSWRTWFLNYLMRNCRLCLSDSIFCCGSERHALNCTVPIDRVHSRAHLKVTVDYITFCSFTNQYLHCWRTLPPLCLLLGSVVHCNKACVCECVYVIVTFVFLCVSGVCVMWEKTSNDRTGICETHTTVRSSSWPWQASGTVFFHLSKTTIVCSVCTLTYELIKA